MRRIAGVGALRSNWRWRLRLLVWRLAIVSHVLHRWTTLRFHGIGARCINTSVADGTRSVGHWRLRVNIRCSISIIPSIHALFVVFFILFTSLVIAASHAYIAADTDTTALLGNDAAKHSALRKPWELLGTEDSEWFRLNL